MKLGMIPAYSHLRSVRLPHPMGYTVPFEKERLSEGACFSAFALKLIRRKGDL